MRGNVEQNFVYCTKGTDIFELGTRPEPGKRNDLTTAVSLLKSGKTLRDIVMEEDVSVAATIVRYPRGMQLVADMLTPSRTEPPLVLWLSGPTGVGKTRAAIELSWQLNVEFWMSNGSLQWFNGFRGQPLAILDDYRTKHAPFEFMLRLLDRYDVDVPFKGGFVPWTPYIIIITAPKSPTDMWNLRTQEDLAQLVRRCHVVSTISEDEDYSDVLTQLESAVSTRWPNAKPWESQLDAVTIPSDAPASIPLHGGNIPRQRPTVGEESEELSMSLDSNSEACEELVEQDEDASVSGECSVSFNSCSTTEEL